MIDLAKKTKDVTRSNKRSLWHDAWLRLKKNKSAVVGMVIMLVVVSLTFGSFLYLDYDEDVVKTDISKRLEFPSKGTLLGRDELGRDIFARIMWGGRISLLAGIFSVIVSASVGGSLGAIAGYYNKFDNIIMRFCDVFMAIPGMLLTITIVSVLEPNIYNLIIALSIGGIPSQARLIRAQVLRIKELEFIEAAKAQGASDFRIIFQHIIPNAISPLISGYVMAVSGGIMGISGLSFIGLGVQAPDPEWGAMLSSGRTFIRDVWHLTAFPGMAIMIVVRALTLVGDGLRDALDPKMKS